eukprot:scaffold5996_cov161-Prasinococcus_capsulatus_cf.AAC.1
MPAPLEHLPPSGREVTHLERGGSADAVSPGAARPAGGLLPCIYVCMVPARPHSAAWPSEAGSGLAADS